MPEYAVIHLLLCQDLKFSSHFILLYAPNIDNIDRAVNWNKHRTVKIFVHISNLGSIEKRKKKIQKVNRLIRGRIICISVPYRVLFVIVISHAQFLLQTFYSNGDNFFLSFSSELEYV